MRQREQDLGARANTLVDFPITLRASEQTAVQGCARVIHGAITLLKHDHQHVAVLFGQYETADSTLDLADLGRTLRDRKADLMVKLGLSTCDAADGRRVSRDRV